MKSIIAFSALLAIFTTESMAKGIVCPVKDVSFPGQPKLLNVAKAGIVPGMVDSQLFQKLLTSCKHLYFPEGNYEFSKGAFKLPSQAFVRGVGEKTVFVIPNTRAPKKPDGAPNLLSFFEVRSAAKSSRESITVRSLHFKRAHDGGNPHHYPVAVSIYGADNFTIGFSKFTNVLILQAGAPKAKSMAPVFEKRLVNRNIKVVRNIAKGSYEYSMGTAHVINTSAVRFRSTYDAVVERNMISGFNHGISWWGGDSDYRKLNHVVGRYKVVKLGILKNTVLDVRQGGIWGSMGQDIKVDSNYVARCNDVCIDPEGSDNVDINRNYVGDGRNGALAAFFASTRISFRANTVYSSHASFPLLKLWELGEEGKMSDIKIHANHFVNYGGGIAMIDDSGRPVSGIDLRWNTGCGVRYNFAASRNVVVSGVDDVANGYCSWTRNSSARHKVGASDEVELRP